MPKCVNYSRKWLVLATSTFSQVAVPVPAVQVYTYKYQYLACKYNYKYQYPVQQDCYLGHYKNELSHWLLLLLRKNRLTCVGAVAEVADPARVSTHEMPRVVCAITADQQSFVVPLHDWSRPRLDVSTTGRCMTCTNRTQVTLCLHNHSTATASFFRRHGVGFNVVVQQYSERWAFFFEAKLAVLIRSNVLTVFHQFIGTAFQKLQ